MNEALPPVGGGNRIRVVVNDPTALDFAGLRSMANIICRLIDNECFITRSCCAILLDLSLTTRNDTELRSVLLLECSIATFLLLFLNHVITICICPCGMIFFHHSLRAYSISAHLDLVSVRLA